MAEPPHKRARRPDSKQMWDEADRAADRRAPASVPSRERERDDRRDDKDRDRNRRYRSRSPRDSRGGRDRDRGGRERDSRGGGRGEGRRDRERDSGRGRDERDRPRERERERERSRDRDRERDRPREAGKRDRERERDRDTRSRSPRKEIEREEKRYEDKAVEKPKELIPEEDFAKERTATPPVSFKVGGAQDHDRMEVDPEMQSMGKRGNVKVKKDKVEEDLEDDEIVIEDDGMAAMQAMMGFGNFGTTHQRKVEGNDISAVRKEKKTEYRQYMNRVGGFNRPLSPTRE